MSPRLPLSVRLASLALGASVAVACTAGGPPQTSDSLEPGRAGAGGSSGASGGGTSAAACAAPGEATPGPADTHCQAPDGGTTVQPTSQASCFPDASGNSTPGTSCPYGATEYGQESDDDDCKYHVRWTSTPICEQGTGAAPRPVVFTVTATHKGDGTPLTGAAAQAEVFTTSPGDWDAATYCDTMSTHVDLDNLFAPMTEGPPGTYTGPVYFDQPGQWTVRFHFFEVCSDVLDDSPHAHAAFHVTVP